MGIQSAMYSGVSGLNTNAQAMSVIGNNLANTNTIGFKGARTVFSDLLSSSVYGSGGLSQVGRGVGVSKVDNIFSQGTFESTNSDTDVAIEGEGFFLVKQPGDDTVHYTRSGAFRFNEVGFLVNPEGYIVQGKQFDANGDLIAGDPDNIQVLNTGLIEAIATTEMEFETNLDAGATAIAAAWDPTDTATYHYAASTNIYDTLGEPHVVTVYFTKTANNAWDWRYTAEDITGADVGQVAGDAAAGALTFLPDGTLDTGGTATLAAMDWANGSDGAIAIDVAFNTTQFTSASTVIGQTQNGFGPGNLTNVTIDSEGIVNANYSNGQSEKISQLVLGKFENPIGLSAAGSNLFIRTNESGDPRVGLPGPELGTIFTNSLEQSNVDMGEEFVRMITTQRGFQANSKIISTVDELLGELINLKR